MTYYMKKSFASFSECLGDHRYFMMNIWSIYNGYVNPFNSVDAQTIESIMLIQNSEQNCSYCTELHGELARLSGIDPSFAKRMDTCGSLNEMKGLVKDDPILIYTKKHAMHNGKSLILTNAFNELVKKIVISVLLLRIPKCCYKNCTFMNYI